jgi:hypothetical protein
LGRRFSPRPHCAAPKPRGNGAGQWRGAMASWGLGARLPRYERTASGGSTHLLPNLKTNMHAVREQQQLATGLQET